MPENPSASLLSIVIYEYSALNHIQQEGESKFLSCDLTNCKY